MEKKREFKSDYSSPNQKDRFTQGDIVTDIEKDGINIKFNIKGIAYLLPYKEFKIATKPLN